MTLRSTQNDLIAESSDPMLASAKHWRRVKMGRVAKISSGFAFKSRYFNDLDGAPIIRIRDLSPQRPHTLYSGPIPDGYWVEPGDLLVGLDGDFRAHKWAGSRALLNQRVAKIEVDSPYYRQPFLEIVLPFYLRALSANTASITVKHLSTRTLENLEIPQPSLQEQDAIVTELTRFDDDAKKIRSELANASELTDKYLKESLIRAYTPNDDPSWQWFTLGELAEIKSGLTLGRRYKPGEKLIERPYLRVANVQRGHLDLTEVKTISLRPDEAERLYLQVGDLLMNEGGDRDKLGRGWLWEGQIADCIHQNHVFRVRLRSDAATPTYLARYINFVAQDFFEIHGKQTSNLASISARVIATLRVPVPSRQSVDQIDRQLDRISAEAADLSREIDQALTLLGTARLALLAAALQGAFSEFKNIAAPLIPARALKPARKLTRSTSSFGETEPNMAHRTSRIPLDKAFGSSEKTLTPEQLFTRAGFTIDEVEEFYGELRALVDSGVLRETSERTISLVLGKGVRR